MCMDESKSCTSIICIYISYRCTYTYYILHVTYAHAGIHGHGHSDICPSLSFSLSPFLSLSVSFSASFSVSLSLCLFVSLSVCLYITMSICRSLSLRISISLSLCELSLSLSRQQASHGVGPLDSSRLRGDNGRYP